MGREARLLPAGVGLYPGIHPGEWRPAAVLADQVLAGWLIRGLGTAILGRVLLNEHFEFRGVGTPGGERGGVRPLVAMA